jgi:protein-tyrosine phosphatase
MGQIWAGLSRFEPSRHLSSWCLENDCQEVVPHVFIGHVGTARDADALKRREIRNILDVSQKNYAAPEGVGLLRLDVPDVPEFDIRSVLGRTNAFLARSRREGKNCLVHCAWGVSRSAAVVLAFLMAYHELTLDQALALLKEKRPVIQPNAGFVAALKEYETELAQARVVAELVRRPLPTT